jgi:hypothetical protein
MLMLLMTDTEWSVCVEPFRMLRYQHGRPVSPRKYRLFGAACCGRGWAVLAADRFRIALDLLERFAESLGAEGDKRALAEAWGLDRVVGVAPDGVASQDLAGRCIVAAMQPRDAWWTAHWSAEAWLHRAPMGESAVLAHLLRDIFGNPFRPLTLDPAHRTPTVISLAQAAYDGRQLPSGGLDPDRLSVLADALEETGAPGELVAHLRSPGPHVRGCWSVDLCLGLS